VAVERDSEERRAYRREFCAFLTTLYACRLVFIDESFCKTGMRREHGWAPRGQRAHGKKPGASWKTLSLIGAIRLGERPRLMTHRGAVNGRIFMKFVRRCLVPFIGPGDIVVMDNLNFHKMKCVREAIAATGARAIYLPTYSPELNPIELLWGDLKRQLRKLGLDCQAALAKAVGRLRAGVPIDKIAGWFRFSLNHAQVK
jgi:transposase